MHSPNVDVDDSYDVGRDYEHYDVDVAVDDEDDEDDTGMSHMMRTYDRAMMVSGSDALYTDTDDDDANDVLYTDDDDDANDDNAVDDEDDGGGVTDDDPPAIAIDEPSASSASRVGNDIAGQILFEHLHRDEVDDVVDATTPRTIPPVMMVTIDTANNDNDDDIGDVIIDGGGVRTVGKWTAYRDHANDGDGDGELYYRNRVTGEYTWDAPPGFEDLDDVVVPRRGTIVDDGPKSSAAAATVPTVAAGGGATGEGTTRTATSSAGEGRQTKGKRRRKRRGKGGGRRNSDIRKKSDLRMAWEMSSGSFGRPRVVENVDDVKEEDAENDIFDDEEEDDDDDDANVPRSDFWKAWALSSSLGCDSTAVVVAGGDSNVVAFLDVDGHEEEDVERTTSRSHPHDHLVSTRDVGNARVDGAGDFRQAWALSSSLGCRRYARSVIVECDDDDNDIEKNDHRARRGRRRLDSGDDSTTSPSIDGGYLSALWTPTPRMARYLCVSSVLLAVCSLGLAATGLGLMYFSATGDDGTGSSASNLSGGGGIGGIDAADGDIIDQVDAEKQVLEELLMDVGFESDAVEDDDVETGPEEVEEGDDGTAPEESVSTQAPSPTSSDDPTDNPTLSPVEPSPTTSPSMRPILLEAPATLLSTTLYSIADTWLEYNGAQPQGSTDFLKVDGVDPRASLLKFNFSSIIENVRSTDDIVGFMLRLYSITDGPFGGKIDLLGDCNDWDEGTLSWINAPECIFRNDSELLVGRFEEEIPPFEWNEAVIFPNFDGDDGGELPTLITLRVSSHYPDGITYASRENVTAIPELVVYYTEPGPTGSPTIAVPSEGPTRAPSSSPIVPTPTTSPLKAPTRDPTVSFRMSFILLFSFMCRLLQLLEFFINRALMITFLLSEFPNVFSHYLRSHR